MALSLVSYYGDKPSELEQMIATLQNHLSNELATAFRPYEMAQVHGTILGLETQVEDGHVYSEWFLKNRGLKQPVDLSGFLAYLRNELTDFHIKIGGYELATNYGFQSRGQPPYLRSFSLQGNVVVAMGWPYEGSDKSVGYSKGLFTLRQAFESFNWCHKWNKDGYQDNDFFFVLGKLDRSLIAEDKLERLSRELRELLMASSLLIPIRKDVLSIVAYSDTELPRSTSRSFALDSNDLSVENLKSYLFNE